MHETALTSIQMQFPRPDVITKEFVSTLKEAGVVEAHLFGSMSRNEERPDSDVDLLVTFGHDFRLTEQLGLIVKLSRIVGRDVEVVTKLDPVLAPYIEPTLKPIPL